MRRIAVALGAEEADAELLERMSWLAAEMAAELSGLFVEDLDLLELARLPFAREVSYMTSTERRLETAELERQLRIQAAAVERALARSAERAGVSWSFRVTRGQVHARVLEAIAEADLLVLAAAGVRLPRPLAASPERGRGPWAPAARRSPIAVVLDRSAAGRAALELGARLADAEGRPLQVFIVAGTLALAERLRETARSLLGDGRAVSYRRVPRHGMSVVARTLRAEAPALAVMGVRRALLSPEAIRTLRQELNCPALLVRGPRAVPSAA